MIIYTIGFTKKTAEVFFELIKTNDIQSLIDVRLNNKSQLAGFAKGKDLDYFLKEICGVQYYYEEEFAPTKDLLDRWHKKSVSWNDYTKEYGETLRRRRAEWTYEVRYKDAGNVCLLCSEPTTENCHRRLLAEYLKENCSICKDAEVVHL